MNKLNIHSLEQLLADKQSLETRKVLKVAAFAESRLGELKGLVKTIPNEGILLNTLLLQEAKDSAEIENIVTTSDDLFQSQIDSKINGPTKEVRAHEDALIRGFKIVRKQKMLKLGDITFLHEILIRNNAGIRKLPGTALKNSAGDIIYTPPPPDQVPDLMSELMEFINDTDSSDLNPLVKMAIIHHQFESIHPFYDGNGRMGRIINLLYLVLAGRLDLPVLYMSHYIITNKAQYYKLLQAVREEGAWEAWLLYMMECISETAKTTIACVNAINELLQRYKHEIREKHPRHYSQDLINNLFKHPYTTVAFLKKDLNCVYDTAHKKLELLANDGYVRKISPGRNSYYINEALVDCLINIHASEHLPDPL